jgi:2,3-dihydroxybenzoate decarboxylase
MSDLIALEEHFALQDTLADSAPYAVSGGWSDLERRLLDLDEIRLAEMDRHGVKLAVLSLNSPGVQAIRRTPAAVDAARRANDVLADAVARHPGRLHGFAALPMQDPEAAAIELRRAVAQLGLAGALVNGFSEVEREAGVVYYDEPDYLPFWAEVERLGVPFYLHPRDPLLTREPILLQYPWLQGSAWAFGVETATHALRLMTSGVFDHCPRLLLILGHLGEGLPFQAWRIDHRMSRSPRGVPAKRTVTDYLRTNVILTTSGQFRSAPLRNALDEVGRDRVLFSIDYPFEDMSEAVTWFRSAAIDDTERAQIGFANASRLLRLAPATAT